MTLTMARALKILEERAEDDPDLAEAVLFRDEEAGNGADPFREPPAGALRAARLLNERRLRERQEAAARAALDTAEVVALIRSISDRKGVDRRRQRGQLLAWRVGSRMLHPDWQFDARRGDTRPGLAQVLAALSELTPDAEAADAVMRTPRVDLDGQSLADLFAAGRVETVVRLIRAAAEQS